MFLSDLKCLRRLERQVKFAKNRCCKIKPVAVLDENSFASGLRALDSVTWGSVFTGSVSALVDVVGIELVLTVVVVTGCELDCSDSFTMLGSWYVSSKISLSSSVKPTECAMM